MIQDDEEDEEDELEDDDDNTQGRRKASSLFLMFAGPSLIRIQAIVIPRKRQKLVGFACHRAGDIER